MSTNGTTRVLRVRDLTDSSRDTTCDVSALGPLLAGWLGEHGVRALPAALTHAVRASDWDAAHRIADALSVDVTPVPNGRTAAWVPGDDWATLADVAAAYGDSADSGDRGDEALERLFGSDVLGDELARAFGF